MRLSVVNIVAACNDPALVESATATVLEVAARHPARVIVLDANREGDAVIESDIALRQSDGTGPIELVRLRVRGQPALHLSSIVQPLLVPDIPVNLWLVGAPPLEQAFRSDAVTLCDVIIIDSAAFSDAAATVRLLQQQLDAFGDALHLGDLAWERLRPWREAVAHAFEGAAMRPWLQRIATVDIVSAGAASALESWLLAGWFASRLERHGGAHPRLRLSMVPRASHAHTEPARVRIASTHGHHVARVELGRRGHALHTSIDVDSGVVASRVTSLERLTDSALLAALIGDADDDPIYAEAVSAALQLIKVNTHG